MHAWLHFWYTVTGANAESGTVYGWWSGVMGGLPTLLIPVSVLTWYWHKTCHVGKCWRPGRHPAAGGAFQLCHRHHPDLAGKRPTLELMHMMHKTQRGARKVSGP